MIPPIQLRDNLETVTVFWELVHGVKRFNLYWSKSGNDGTYTLLKGNIPNFGAHSPKTTGHKFTRGSLGLLESDNFYLKLTTVGQGNIESDITLSSSRMIPSISNHPVDEGTVYSFITKSNNLTRPIGNNPVRILFEEDIAFMEIFNNSATTDLFVDITGDDASVEKSMPVKPYTYYTVFRNLPKDSGISLVAGPGELVDARIVVHN